MSCCVYVVSSPKDPAQYVGCTSNARSRWKGHKESARKRATPLGRAMAENGMDTYNLEIVSTFESMEDALTAEGEMIRKLLWDGSLLHNVAINGGHAVRPLLGTEETEEYDKLSRLEAFHQGELDFLKIRKRKMANKARARMRKEKQRERF